MCLNNATCLDGVSNYSCECMEGYEGQFCETKIDNCNDVSCLNGGTCETIGSSFKCNCQPGFEGTYCEIGTNECDSMPCQNGGTCQDLIAEYKCTCLTGYTGDDCEVNIDDCVGVTCHNNATCVDLVNDYQCQCAVGWTGDHCESMVDDCESVTCSNGGTCVDLLNDFMCKCIPGFSGKHCEVNIDECVGVSCNNHGTCQDLVNDYECECFMGYTGDQCESMVDDCDGINCLNGGSCIDLLNNFTCVCVPGYTGLHCEMDIDECASDPCQNDATCLDLVNEFECQCPLGFTGEKCENNIDDCLNHKCLNNANCQDGINEYTCECMEGYEGQFCETEMNQCHGVSCLNGGTCETVGLSFICNCEPGFEGEYCQFGIDECDPMPCQNGGTCRDLIADYECTCLIGYTGDDCEVNVDDCVNVTCHNEGTCMDLVNGYQCQCSVGWSGTHCESMVDDCENVTCLNGGTCVDQLNNYYCDCSSGFTGEHCETNIDDCEDATCVNGNCIDLVNGYECECFMGYTGNECESMVDDCIDIECLNGGTCLDMLNNYTCVCVPGYTGQYCEVDIDDCTEQSCQNNGTCVDMPNDFECECLSGFNGDLCEINIDDCINHQCLNNATCIDGINEYFCDCVEGYSDQYCQTSKDDCIGISCLNGGECEDIGATYMCNCLPGFGGEFCGIGIDECEPMPCQNNGTCRDFIADYTCTCSLGYTGKDCEVNIDDCVNVTCQNNGVCEDQVNDYKCICSAGWTGDLCESMIDDCESVTCQNGGTCVDLLNDYMCQCIPGFTGVHCETNIDDCVNVSCSNQGICQDLVNGYECECFMGYMGDHCQSMVDDCEDVICLNGGSCVDLLNNFTCVCVPGYTGLHCGTDINECDGEPCQNNATCLDLINEFDCECLNGFEGDLCEININECESEPCVNGGSCIDQINDFQCVCPPIYTGTRCDVEVNLCLLDPCVNNGTCTPTVVADHPSFTCFCAPPFEGEICELNNQCLLNPCMNDATCIPDTEMGTYNCNCANNYYGNNCESFDYCHSDPCLNGGSCTNHADNFLCECTDKYIGDTCEELITPCTFGPCENGGTCSVEGDSYICDCPIGYHTRNCSEETIANNITPTFGGNSHTCVNAVNSSFDLRFSFKTDSQNGLLAYANTTDGYVLIRVMDRFVRADIAQGNNKISLVESDRIFTDDVWHDIVLTFGSQSIHLQVDDQRDSDSTTKQASYIELSSDLCFGNIPVGKQSLGAYTPSFAGSFGSMIELNGVSINILEDSTQGMNVGNPDDSSCDPYVCNSNGNCMESEMSDVGYTCECYYGYQGSNCKTDININVPYFTSSSWMQVSSQTVKDALEVDASVSITSSNGLVFYLLDDEENFITVGLVDDQIVVQHELNGGLVSDVYYVNASVSNGEWNILVLRYSESGVSLMVNNITYSLSSLTHSFSTTFDVYVGEFVETIPVSLNLTQSAGFEGSMIELQINDKEINLADSNVNIGRNLEQSPMAFCSYILCMNDGVCVETIADPWFVCECPFGYTGQFCEISLPFCDPNPCIDGECEEYEDRTFMCTCHLGYKGRFCEEELNITVPSFYGNSYITYPTLTNSAVSQTITISFKPIEANGLLLFNSFSRTDFRDYISLTILDSYVVYRFDLGSGHVEIKSTSPIALNKWHTVTISRTGINGSLVVNDMKAVYGASVGPLKELTIHDVMWLGGHRHNVNVSSVTGTETGLVGCISALDINGESVDFVMDAESGFGVGECNVTSCEENPCLNGGICVPVGNNFVCNCTSTHTGPLCASDFDHCGTNPCLNGGTCVEYTNSTGYYCICTTEYKGKRCNQTSAIVVPSFSDLSYLHLQMPSDVFIVTTTNIVIRFSAYYHSGLLLYFGDVTLSSDFLSLSLLNGYVQLRFNLGSTTVILTSDSSVSLNNWHTVEVRRTGKTAYLIVDGVETSSVTSAGTPSQLNVGGFGVYVGGIEDSSVFSLSAGSDTSLRGCVYSLQINSVAIDLTESVISGRNIMECSMPSCSMSPCKNGGTCVSTGSHYTCICPLGKTGNQCETSITVDVPLFSSHYSYISYNSLQGVFMTSFTIEINSNTSTGLILYNGGLDYIALLLRNGFVELFYDLGFGYTKITSKNTISLYEWHTIEVNRIGPNAQLILDDSPPAVGTSIEGTMLQLGSNDGLHLGGTVDFSVLPTELDSPTAFSGCIRSFSISNSLIGLISSAIEGRDIGECSDVLGCLDSPCQNEANCTNEGFDKSFSCSCLVGYTGDECDSLITECMNTSFCDNGGECIPKVVDDTLVDSCLCSLPYEGTTCSNRLSFENASFTGTSILELPVTSIPISKMRIRSVIEFTFTPTASDGLILYIGRDDPSDGDYLAVGLRNYSVEFQFELGNGVGVAMSDTRISLNQTYTIVAVRTDNRGRVLVDGVGGELAESPPGSVDAYELSLDNTDLVLYVGGLTNSSNLPKLQFSTGFNGCVGTPIHVGFPENTEEILIDSALTGISVQTCSSTSPLVS